MFYLLLPNIRSCHNVGAMFRTADAFGVDKIFLIGYTANPPKPQIDKVALGAEKWIKWSKRKSLGRLLKKLKQDNFLLIGLEKTDNSLPIQSLVDKKIKFKHIALVVGNEVVGLDKKYWPYLDILTHIPMFGRKESLNVSVAAGIGMYVIKNLINKYEQ